jgi:hypothetical protein
MQISDDVVRVACDAYEQVPDIYDKFGKMRAAISAALAAMWRPISEAPKDGTWIIAIRPECNFGRYDRVLTVQWSDENKAFIWADHFDIFKDDMDERDDNGNYVFDPFESNEFTHFMPLPSPPSTNKEKAHV